MSVLLSYCIRDVYKRQVDSWSKTSRHSRSHTRQALRLCVADAGPIFYSDTTPEAFSVWISDIRNTTDIDGPPSPIPCAKNSSPTSRTLAFKFVHVSSGLILPTGSESAFRIQSVQD